MCDLHILYFKIGDKIVKNDSYFTPINKNNKNAIVLKTSYILPKLF